MLEVLPLGASKGAGLKWLLEHLQVGGAGQRLGRGWAEAGQRLGRLRCLAGRARCNQAP